MRGLGLWQGSVTTLPEGTFRLSGSTLYVHLWNHDNPATANVRVASFAHSVNDGSRGLIATSRNAGYGHYITFKRIWSIGANGVGFSSSGRDARCEDCRVTAAGMDGVLGYSELTGSGENGDGLRFYGTNNPL